MSRILKIPFESIKKKIPAALVKTFGTLYWVKPIVLRCIKINDEVGRKSHGIVNFLPH